MEGKISICYESNSNWGQCNTLEDLAEQAKMSIEADGNIINLVSDFLHGSRRSKYLSSGNNFGRRGEHTGAQTLHNFLLREGLLDDFLKTCSDMGLK